MKDLQAIVLDYDGVLADTEPLHLRAFQETLTAAGVGLTREEYFDDYLGLDDEAVFRAVAANRGLDWQEATFSGFVADKARRFLLISSRERVLFPGVADLLQAWSRQVTLAIASGSLRHEVEAVLDAAGLRAAVPVLVAAGETANGKPHPDPYLRALELLAVVRRPASGRLDPGRAVAIEDSPWGIESAHAAGMRAVAVTTSYPASRLADADAVVPCLTDITLDFLARVVCSPAPGRG